jgi:hypothetical protein
MNDENKLIGEALDAHAGTSVALLATLDPANEKTFELAIYAGLTAFVLHMSEGKPDMTMKQLRGYMREYALYRLLKGLGECATEC